MTTAQLRATFEDRRAEIEEYLKVVDALDEVVKSGKPKIGEVTVTSQQQKIIYSSVYLQVYNLVESTMSGCIKAVWHAVCGRACWTPAQLAPQIRRELIRLLCKTHEVLHEERRLEATAQFVESMVAGNKIERMPARRQGVGSWDDKAIEDLSEKWGILLVVPQEVLANVKRRVADDKGCLELVKDRRNRLAHGDISFAECGAEVSPDDLKRLVEHTSRYLEAVLTTFIRFISEGHFLGAGERQDGCEAPPAE